MDNWLYKIAEGETGPSEEKKVEEVKEGLGQTDPFKNQEFLSDWRSDLHRFEENWNKLKEEMSLPIDSMLEELKSSPLSPQEKADKMFEFVAKVGGWAVTQETAIEVIEEKLPGVKLKTTWER